MDDFLEVEKLLEYDNKFSEFLQKLNFNYCNNHRKNAKNAVKMFRKILAEFLDIFVHDIDDFLSSLSVFMTVMEFNIDNINAPEFIKNFIMQCVISTYNNISNMLLLPQSKEYPTATNLLTSFVPKTTRVLDVGAGEYPISTIYLGSKFDPKVIGIEKDDCFFLNSTLNRFNAEVRQQLFTSKTNVDNFDMLVGFAPCDATKDLIKNAVMHNKPYFIRLCECSDLSEWKDMLLPIDSKINFCNDYAFNMDVSNKQMSREIEKQLYNSEFLDPYDPFDDIEDFDFSHYLNELSGLDINLNDVLDKIMSEINGKSKE